MSAAARAVTRSCTKDARGMIVKDKAEALAIARKAKRVAVLGIKTEEKRDQPAYYVPEYLQSAGVKVVPVPVYFPEATHILGEKVFRKVSDIPDAHTIDILDVFRRPKDLGAHLEDILRAGPKTVWLQSGISDPDFEQVVAEAGIKVVVSRCLLVDHQEAMQQSNL